MQPRPPPWLPAQQLPRSHPSAPLRRLKPMWLAIDAGNTNVVLGVFDDQARLVRTYRLSTHPIGTADELKARIQALLAASDTPRKLEDFKDVVLASVVPRFTRIARRAL